jgi:hypothetical protein
MTIAGFCWRLCATFMVLTVAAALAAAVSDVAGAAGGTAVFAERATKYLLVGCAVLGVATGAMFFVSVIASIWSITEGRGSNRS